MNEQDDVFEEENTQESFVFHYRQGSFRKREDKATRDLATGVSLVKPGLFKALVSTRGNRFMLLALVACTVLAFAVYLMEHSGGSSSIGDVNISLSTFSFEEQVYVSLEFSPSKKTKKTALYKLELVFSAINSEGQLQDIYKTPYLYENKREGSAEKVTCRFSDYDIHKVQCLVSSDQKSVILDAVVK